MEIRVGGYGRALFTGRVTEDAWVFWSQWYDENYVFHYWARGW